MNPNYPPPPFYPAGPPPPDGQFQNNSWRPPQPWNWNMPPNFPIGQGFMPMGPQGRPTHPNFNHPPPPPPWGSPRFPHAPNDHNRYPVPDQRQIPSVRRQTTRDDANASPSGSQSRDSSRYHRERYHSNSSGNHRPDPTLRSQDSSYSRSSSSTRKHHDSRHRDSKERQHQSDEEECDFNEEYSTENLQEKLQALKPSYVQCTQHAKYYGRTTEGKSTVKALPALIQLHNKFEQTLSTRHAKLWEPNKTVSNYEVPGELTDENVDSSDGNLTLSESLKHCNVSQESLPRQQRVCAAAIVKKFEDKARNLDKPLLKYIEEDNPRIPEFALPKLKRRLERLTENIADVEKKSDSSSAEEETYNQENYLDRAGELISSIRNLKHHEMRLHNELWYNDPGQANDGPLCRCSAEAQKKGIRHNIYPGEKPESAWKNNTNSVNKMYNYLVMISPPVNFITSNPTVIHYDGRDYQFEGFSLLTDEPLEKLPLCDIIRFHIRYTIYLIDEPVPENFCVKGLKVFSDFFFRDVLELYDWVEKDASSPLDTDSEIFRKFHFFPRFTRPLPENGKEILSLCEVLKYFLDSSKPLVNSDDLDHLMKCDHKEWLNYTNKVRGMIVTYPGRKPSSLRIDQLDRYNRKSVENPSKGNDQDDEFPLIIHFGIRPANLSYAGDPQYQRVWRSYLKLRHLMANTPKVKYSDKVKLKNREEALQEMRRAKVMQREVTVEVSSRGFMRTGIYSDMCQHALLLPVLTHHIRYQLCLAALEKQIGYEFKERKWLSHAMNHPSCQMNFGSNPDHVRNALSNCGLRQPKYGDSSIHYKYTRKRGITTLIRIMARLGQKRPVLSPIEHNERLEFLGDAVVGYLTSIHLFFMFPELSEGALTTFRTVIVNNQHLAQLAERMHLDEYMLYAHGPDLCRNADLRHAMANCFEALMGAIYMEAGLEKSQELFARFIWDCKELQDIWLDVPLHPLQEEEPGTDRQYIESVPLLKNLTKFEDEIGVKFNHVRVLAKAFTWRNVHENVLTHGHNQRLEFLGDSICNLVTSTYLFKLYPTHHEGHLTLLRATMVNGRTQSMVATELGMPKYVITNMGNDSLGNVAKPRAPDWREKNLADLLEAFVAALYIDKGLEYVEQFMQVIHF